MKGPSAGVYLIRLAQYPIPYIGVDDPALGSPVSSYGREGLWRVTKLENGNYTIALEEDNKLFVQDEEILIVGPTPCEWSIYGVGDHYVIEVPNIVTMRPTIRRAWTIRNPRPKEPVTADFIERPRPNQLWDFIVWSEPEELGVPRGSKSVAKKSV